MVNSYYTIIVIQTQDFDEPHKNLKKILEYAYIHYPDYVKKYRFLINNNALRYLKKNKSSKEISYFLNSNSYHELPSFSEDSGMILNWLIVQKYVSLTWSFMKPNESHLYTPFTDTFLRLCDVWNVKKYITLNAVYRWFLDEYSVDEYRNRQKFPPKIELRKHLEKKHPDKKMLEIKWEKICDLIKKNQKTKNNLDENMNVEETTIALVVELPLIDKLVDLVMNYEEEFKKFHAIITTNNIGQVLKEKIPSLTKIYEYHSAPKGGFMEISTEIILGKCDALIFLTDPLEVHPYRQDTKLVFNSCILSNTIKVITNESHAKEWLENSIRKGILNKTKPKKSSSKKIKKLKKK